MNEWKHELPKFYSNYMTNAPSLPIRDHTCGQDLFKVDVHKLFGLKEDEFWSVGGANIIEPKWQGM